MQTLSAQFRQNYRSLQSPVNSPRPSFGGFLISETVSESWFGPGEFQGLPLLSSRRVCKVQLHFKACSHRVRMTAPKLKQIMDLQYMYTTHCWQLASVLLFMTEWGYTRQLCHRNKPARSILDTGDNREARAARLESVFIESSCIQINSVLVEIWDAEINYPNTRQDLEIQIGEKVRRNLDKTLITSTSSLAIAIRFVAYIRLFEILFCGVR